MKNQNSKLKFKYFLFFFGIFIYYGSFTSFASSLDKNQITIITVEGHLEHLNVEALDYFQIGEMPRARNVTSIKEDYKNLYNDRTINIIAEWYKKDNKQIKLIAKIISRELRSEGIKLKVFVKNKKNEVSEDEDLARKIENLILTKARSLRLQNKIN